MKYSNPKITWNAKLLLICFLAAQHFCTIIIYKMLYIQVLIHARDAAAIGSTLCTLGLNFHICWWLIGLTLVFLRRSKIILETRVHTNG